MKIIDAHLHIWNLEKVDYSWLTADLGVLYQNYELNAMPPLMAQAGVSKAILVQAANSIEETDFMLASAENSDFVSGVVGWLPLLNPDLTAKYLEKYKKISLFKGVRHLIHDEPNPYWVLQDTVIESLKLLADNGIPFDVVGVLSEHLACVKQLGEKIPHLYMMIDHLNHPRGMLSAQIMGKWEEGLREVTQNPKVYAKISGLGTAVSKKSAQLSQEDMKPAILKAIESFGADRCLVGGDYPVSLLAENYPTTWKFYQNIIDEMLSLAERESIYWENANKFYKLAV
ncbi:MAG: amidohydrolase family protein [Thermoflexibacter sp.]|jgi:L-fuconolactonase|nr:amidohydrolase family protein [Thermoflexibacter sp.]